MQGKVLIDIADGIVTAEQSQTNVTHTFFVEDDYDSLDISYKYTPKKVYDEETCKNEIIEGIIRYAPDMIPDGETETLRKQLLSRWMDNIPMLNHITLSVKQGDCYLGAAHRHDSIQHHVIGQTFSSPGFVRTSIKRGEWKITLNVHAALSAVNYSLEVVGRKNNI